MYSIMEAGIENMGVILINYWYQKSAIKWKASQLVAHVENPFKELKEGSYAKLN